MCTIFVIYTIQVLINLNLKKMKIISHELNLDYSNQTGSPVRRFAFFPLLAHSLMFSFPKKLLFLFSLLEGIPASIAQ